jgi:hypothetical protein
MPDMILPSDRWYFSPLLATTDRMSATLPRASRVRGRELPSVKDVRVTVASFRGEGGEGGFRCLGEDPKQGTRRAAREAFALLPVPDGRDRQA